MSMNDLGAARYLLIAVCVLIYSATSGCKREQPQQSAPVAAGAQSSATTATSARGPGSPFAATVEAVDLPDQPDRPLRAVFGERGAGVAYLASRPDGGHVIHNGKLGRAVTLIDQVSISPNGMRVAYSAQLDGQWRMVVDDEPGVMSTSVGDPVFSLDSRHIAYDARIEQAKRLVVDGRTGPERLAFTGRPFFSSDSALVAFAEVTAENGPARLVVSDLALAKQRVVASGVVSFVANDGATSIAAVVEEKKKQRLLLAGFSLKGEVEKGPPYESISNVAFSPGGASVAYVAEQTGKRVLVLDGTERPLPHADATDLAYGGGTVHAYAVQDGESWRIVANGTEGPPFDRVVSPRFSPDGKYLVYRARKDGKRFVVVADTNGKTIRELPPYEQVFPVQFTADGKSITYGVKDGNQLAWKVEPLP